MKARERCIRADAATVWRGESPMEGSAQSDFIFEFHYTSSKCSHAPILILSLTQYPDSYIRHTTSHFNAVNNLLGMGQWLSVFNNKATTASAPASSFGYVSQLIGCLPSRHKNFSFLLALGPL